MACGGNIAVSSSGGKNSHSLGVKGVFRLEHPNKLNLFGCETPYPHRPIFPNGEEDFYFFSNSYLFGRSPTKMMSHSDVSNGQRDIEGILNELKKTHRNIMKNESRIWLEI